MTLTQDAAAKGAGVLVFVPTFNDAESAIEVVADVRAALSKCRILVIDDGSRVPIRRGDLGDEVLLFTLPDNFGIGTATHIAFDHALRFDYAAVVRIDADGQHRAEDIPQLLRALAESGADFVVGGRVNQDVGRSLAILLRRLIKTYFAVVSRLLAGIEVPRDVTSGLFAASRHAVKVLNRFELDRFPEPQMSILSCREKLRVREVPVEQRQRQRGTSTLTVMHAARMLYRFNMFVLGELLRGQRS